MKAPQGLSLFALILFSSATILAQDAVKADPTHYKVLFENASVRVLKVDYAPGAKSQMHAHPDALIVALGPAKVRFTAPDGKAEEREFANESATFTPAGTHSPENLGARIDGVLVEFKTKAPGKATPPATREGLTMKVLAESPRAMVQRTTAGPTFHEPAGSKHDYDQLVIALGPSEMALSLDGKPGKTKWARGDVQFIGRGVPHESKNAGGKPVDFVIVAIK
jgi:quercetin dioxygenase-like cupin family protein